MATVVTSLPETVQTPGVMEAIVTVRPDVALAEMANGIKEKLFVPGLAKLMVWLALEMVRVKVCMTVPDAFIALTVSG